MNNAQNTQKDTHIQVQNPNGFHKMLKCSLPNKTLQPNHRTTMPAGTADRQEKSVKSDRRSLSG